MIEIIIRFIGDNNLEHFLFAQRPCRMAPIRSISKKRRTTRGKHTSCPTVLSHHRRSGNCAGRSIKRGWLRAALGLSPCQSNLQRWTSLPVYYQLVYFTVATTAHCLLIRLSLLANGRSVPFRFVPFLRTAVPSPPFFPVPAFSPPIFPLVVGPTQCLSALSLLRSTDFTPPLPSVASSSSNISFAVSLFLRSKRILYFCELVELAEFRRSYNR